MNQLQPMKATHSKAKGKTKPSTSTKKVSALPASLHSEQPVAGLGVTFEKVETKKVIPAAKFGSDYDNALASITEAARNAVRKPATHQAAATATIKKNAQAANTEITPTSSSVFEIPAGLESLVMGIASKKSEAQAKVKGKAGRKSVLTAAREAVAKGEMPALLEFASQANYTYNRHADALHKLAVDKCVDKLVDYPINGVNTYAKALRGYRDLLVQYVKGAV